MDLTGRHLGKYELLERVGKGGMAYVYKAYQPTIDRHVAVKVLHSHLAEDGQFLERFKREAKGLGGLRHPHIVSVIDFDEEDGWYYMVMDFIEGETLEAMLSRRGRLPVDEALRLTAQLAGALDYAHRNDRIHRDIKPSNVMFADDAQQHAVITDFGLTRLLDNATITISGTIAGTPAYMSPEAAQGEKVDARADIYSLGVMLYEMVTGRRPYSGETPLSIIMKLVLEPLPPALSINPDLPPAVDEIISKATAKAPEDRYQKAAAFLEAIENEIGDSRLEIGSQAATVVTGDKRTEILSPLAPAQRAQEPVAVGEAEPLGQPKSTQSRSTWLPLLAGLGMLLVVLVVGFVLLNGLGGESPEETPVPTLDTAVVEVTSAPTETVEPPAEIPTPQVAAEEGADPGEPEPAGSLQFAEPNDDGLRPYTVVLEDVPPPPAASRYQLWFDFAGQEAPENVATIAPQEGRISYTDVLVENLAASVTAVRISLEPDFDDDPTISADVAYTGTVDAEAGLANIEMFATALQQERVDSLP